MLLLDNTIGTLVNGPAFSTSVTEEYGNDCKPFWFAKNKIQKYQRQQCANACRESYISWYLKQWLYLLCGDTCKQIPLTNVVKWYTRTVGMEEIVYLISFFCLKKMDPLWFHTGHLNITKTFRLDLINLNFADSKKALQKLKETI